MNKSRSIVLFLALITSLSSFAIANPPDKDGTSQTESASAPEKIISEPRVPYRTLSVSDGEPPKKRPKQTPALNTYLIDFMVDNWLKRTYGKNSDYVSSIINMSFIDSLPDPNNPSLLRNWAMEEHGKGKIELPDWVVINLEKRKRKQDNELKLIYQRVLSSQRMKGSRLLPPQSNLDLLAQLTIEQEAMNQESGESKYQNGMS